MNKINHQNSTWKFFQKMFFFFCFFLFQVDESLFIGGFTLEKESKIWNHQYLSANLTPCAFIDPEPILKMLMLKTRVKNFNNHMHAMF